MSRTGKRRDVRVGCLSVVGIFVLLVIVGVIVGPTKTKHRHSSPTAASSPRISVATRRRSYKTELVGHSHRSHSFHSTRAATAFWRQQVAAKFQGPVAEGDGRGCAQATRTRWVCTAYVKNLSHDIDVYGTVTISDGIPSATSQLNRGSQITVWFEETDGGCNTDSCAGTRISAPTLSSTPTVAYQGTAIGAQHGPATDQSSCGSNSYTVGPDTSCEFGGAVSSIVGKAYTATGHYPASVTAHSTVTGRTYTLRCTGDWSVELVCAVGTSEVTVAISKPLATPPARATTTVETTGGAGATTTTAGASCTPLTDSGNCYEPGEFCRDSDHGVTGIDANGEAITCEDNDGWRWEPS